jgi:L-serine dehydratase
MKASYRFAQELNEKLILSQTSKIYIELFGSLAMTGKGHGTDRALVLGLEGHQPETLDIEDSHAALAKVLSEQKVNILQSHRIPFKEQSDIKYHRRKSLPAHPNGMQFSAFDNGNTLILSQKYYSIGGGFIASDDNQARPQKKMDPLFHFKTGHELLSHCSQTGFSISQIMLKNEQLWHSEADIHSQLNSIWQVMEESIKRGCHTEGHLPGGLQVKRRAPQIYRRLKGNARTQGDPLNILDWINCFALAVSEENAAGSKIVTAPTNGAAGIIPAVLKYFAMSKGQPDPDEITRFFMTAAAIGILFKENASISGAEVGCQGEVGVACSMAAAGLTELLGGTPEQVENAAEIGIEHNLGLTCDPIGGLVQVPCIERNAMGAIKAINASRLALQGDGQHKVSLDKAIATMRQTGADMMSKYKETSRGGLAVNIVEC